MVFYVIAAAEKDNKGQDARTLSYKSEQDVAKKITSLKSFKEGKDASALYPVKVRLPFPLTQLRSTKPCSKSGVWTS